MSRDSTAGTAVTAREQDPAERAEQREPEEPGQKGDPAAGPPEPGTTGESAEAAEPSESGGAERTRRGTASRRLRVAGVALLAALLLAGTGLLVQAARLNGDDALANRALTDASATAAVSGDVSNALSKVFSYAPEDPGVTARDADELLAGRAREQYRRLFGQIQQRVVAQELTLTTHVVRAGVVRLDGDDATLLVLLDQVTERRGEDPASVGAQLSVTAEKQDGQWRITDLKSR
ncbi:hypothetical protein GCM10010400_13520 [Streptomyces aculeolatus]|uniref:nuclear transport factor 2 family protein n=1 Tax=Streptomyces aculeolatus TaxID=270689 RepID=UPI001CEC05E0|nr:nuclear transport factor 2 family protein [Streptomyces aculeolatus]